jgi:hypothetical protein
MKEEKDIHWASSVVTAEGYPVDIHVGYIASKNRFAAPLPKTGTIYTDWTTNGTEMMSGGTGIPTELSLTWVSYAEKKFWKVEAALDSDKIRPLLTMGFTNYDRYGDKLAQEYFEHIVVAVAPGGLISVLLTGPWRRVEVGRYHAKEIFVDVNAFYDNPDNDNQQQFFDWWYNNIVPLETKNYIKAYGIPYYSWETNNRKYHWRFLIQFYKTDKESTRDCTYVNGEREQIYGAGLDSVTYRPLPLESDFIFVISRKRATAAFDSAELRLAFKEMLKDNPGDKPIEIVGKIEFMYEGVGFSVRCGDKSIPLEKVKVGMWGIGYTKKEKDSLRRLKED